MPNYYSAGFTRMLGLREEGVTVWRRQGTEDGNYGSSPDYVELDRPRAVVVTESNEVRQRTQAGERQDRTMVVYSRTDVDLQVNDRFEYGTVKYEVNTKVGRPTHTTPVAYRYEVERV